MLMRPIVLEVRCGRYRISSWKSHDLVRNDRLVEMVKARLMRTSALIAEEDCVAVEL